MKARLQRAAVAAAPAPAPAVAVDPIDSQVKRISIIQNDALLLVVLGSEAGGDADQRLQATAVGPAHPSPSR